MLHFLDTNVLLYSISGNPAERAKQAHAVTLLNDDECALSVQVLQEFYVQSTRSSRPDALTHQQATGLIATWQRFTIQAITVPVVQRALHIRDAWNLSYWDSAILAAASILGCDRVYTEDLNNGQIVDGVKIVNPFL